jgi:hypothetical protein
LLRLRWIAGHDAAADSAPQKTALGGHQINRHRISFRVDFLSHLTLDGIHRIHHHHCFLQPSSQSNHGKGRVLDSRL